MSNNCLTYGICFVGQEGQFLSPAMKLRAGTYHFL